MGELNALEQAWGIIANVSGGVWQEQTPEWQQAAAQWRDEVYLPATAEAREKEEQLYDADGLRIVGLH